MNPTLERLQHDPVFIEEAYEMLRACARSSNTPIHDVAHAVVHDAGGIGTH